MSTSAKAKPKAKKAPGKKAKPKATKRRAARPEPRKERRRRAPPKEKAPEKREEAAERAVSKQEPVPLGPAPSPVVGARHLDSLHERPGRGFSFGELASAGVPLDAARRVGLRLDIRRRSVLDGNVDSLKGWFKSQGSGDAPKKQAAAASASKRR